jgi:hypothetical protein
MSTTLGWTPPCEMSEISKIKRKRKPGNRARTPKSRSTRPREERRDTLCLSRTPRAAFPAQSQTVKSQLCSGAARRVTPRLRFQPWRALGALGVPKSTLAKPTPKMLGVGTLKVATHASTAAQTHEWYKDTRMVQHAFFVFAVHVHASCRDVRTRTCCISSTGCTHAHLSSRIPQALTVGSCTKRKGKRRVRESIAGQSCYAPHTRGPRHCLFWLQSSSQRLWGMSPSRQLF